MSQVLDLTTDAEVRRLATPSNILAGRELRAQGEVHFSAVRPDYVEAKVVSPLSGTRSVRFALQGDKLTWHCTCTRDPKLFCKHLVAASLAVQQEGHGDTIHKVAGIVIQDRKLLVERSVGKPVFQSPGGRIEAGEGPKRTLVRELKEEIGIDVAEDDLVPFGDFSAQAANHPGQQAHIQVFTVTKWQGTIRPGAEVEELLWLTSALPKGVQVGSIFEHEIVPRLKKQNLID